VAEGRAIPVNLAEMPIAGSAANSRSRFHRRLPISARAYPQCRIVQLRSNQNLASSTSTTVADAMAGAYIEQKNNHSS
jgi:hypothetical protein